MIVHDIEMNDFSLHVFHAIALFKNTIYQYFMVLHHSETNSSQQYRQKVFFFSNRILTTT